MQRPPLDVTSSLCSGKPCCTEDSTMDRSSDEACCCSSCSRSCSNRCSGHGISSCSNGEERSSTGMESEGGGRDSGSCIPRTVHEKNRCSRSCSRTLPCSLTMSRFSSSGRCRRRLAAWVLPLAVAVVTLSWLRLASGATVTDQFVPMCSDYSDPPPSGWQLWSNSTTWPAGVVPGVGGSMGVDVVIPCDTGVILDTNVTVGTLEIFGSLKVVHAGPFQVFANFIVNQGRLTIGTPSAPYTGKIIFNLTGSNTEYPIKRSPSNPNQPDDNPHTLGTRAFITLGGQLSLNGMYGNNPGWTTLAATAQAGATALRLKGDVGAWPIGGQIAIASTDYDRNQAEYRTITSVQRLVRAGAATVTVVGLSAPLQWMHWGDPLATGVAGVSMDEAAEVVLLSRAIVVQGHPNPVDPLIGGHFIVVQTPWPQSIIGVELANMGQQGNLGRYPMHFHLCQDVTGSLVKSCVVHRSNQRCYVVHGTWNLRLEGNAAVNTKGHCYLLEDGVEMGNQFINNVGFLQSAPQRTIQASDPFPPVVSDNAPSTFWISNANNTFIGNVAGGSEDSGWWFEVGGHVAGPSSLFPNAVGMSPYLIPMAVFENNTAHSNGRAGLRTYPSGYRPRMYGGKSDNQNARGINAPPASITFTGFRAYKNQYIGMFIHETDTVVLDKIMIADNAAVGVELNRAQGVTITNSVFLGETDNVGNPTGCANAANNPYAGCRAHESASSCTVSPISTSLVRSSSTTLRRDWDMFGILIDADDDPSHGTPGVPHRIVNTVFAKFYPQCRNAAGGITANGAAAAFWTAAHSSSSIVVPDASPAIWMVRANQGHLGFEVSSGDAGSQARFYTWRDEDGSLLRSAGVAAGPSGGYAVTALSPELLPVNSNCTLVTKWNAYACPGACYRSIRIQGGNAQLTRLSDGSAIRGDSTMNVAANSAYVVTFPNGVAPSSLAISYADFDRGCNAPLVLRFPAPSTPNTVWQVAASSRNVFWQACLGTDVQFASVTQIRYICDASTGGKTFLQLTLGASYTSTVVISQAPGTPVACSFQQCGLFMAQSNWSYYDKGNAPSDFLRTAGSLSTSWKVGRAQFGFGGVGENTTVAYPGPGQLAWFFRRTFNLKSAGCYRQLLFGYLADDGIVVYINGGEVLRVNMPTYGTVTTATPASSRISATAPWASTAISTDDVLLRSGLNTIMVELHVASGNSLDARFDMWLAATGNGCPTALFFNPRSIALTPPAASSRSKSSR